MRLHNTTAVVKHIRGHLPSTTIVTSTIVAAVALIKSKCSDEKGNQFNSDKESTRVVSSRNREVSPSLDTTAVRKNLYNSEIYNTTTRKDDPNPPLFACHPSSSLFASIVRLPPSPASSLCCQCEATKTIDSIALEQRKSLISDTANKKQRINNVYRVHRNRVMGEGAFGSVYLATQRAAPHEDVALKLIPKKFTSNDTFAREMNALLKIQDASNGGHPNICGLREHFEEEDHYYLMLDLVSGGEMFDHLIKIGAYSEADAARLVQEVASALAFLHGIGVVHGDLKPENLMLSTDRPGDGVIKLVDFGCATIMDDSTDVSISGTKSASPDKNRALTPAYCAPEVFRDMAPDPSADMWAMGIILYIMLTGLHPFDLTGTTTDEEIVVKIKKKEKPPLRNSPITAHLSPSAIDLIERLMDWDASKRLTAHEMLQHPWVRGETANTNVMVDSDKKLGMRARAFQTRLEADVFADMVSQDGDTDPSFIKTSLIERSFRKFDRQAKGFLTTSDLQKGLPHTNNTDGKIDNKTQNTDDTPLSLSGFSNLLSENMKNQYFQAKDIVYREDDIGDHMYFINSGTIEVTTKDGCKTQRHRGDSFGEGALLHPHKLRSATIRCVTPVHAIQISRSYFEKFIANEGSSESNAAPTLLTLKEKDRTRKRNRAKTILRIQQNVFDRDYKYNDCLFQPGDDSDSLFINEHGKINIEVDGQEVVSIDTGGLCGEHSTLMNRPRNCSARCVSPDGCRVQVMNGKDLRFLMEASSNSMRDALEEICLRREFRKAIVKKTQRPFPKGDDVTSLKEVFDAVHKGGKDVISYDDLKTIMMLFDDTFEESEIKAVLDSLDLNESGSVTFEEFQRVFGMDANQAASI